MDSEDIKELESIVKQKDQELIDLALEGFKSWEDGARSKALWRLLKYDKAVAIDATKRMLERDQSSSIGEILEKSHTTKHKDFGKKILTKIGHLRNIEDKHAINGISLLINRYLSYSRIADRVCFPPKQYKLRIEATKALLNFGLKDVIVFLEDSLINDKSIRVRKLASLMLAKIRQLKGAENKRKRNDRKSNI